MSFLYGLILVLVVIAVVIAVTFCAQYYFNYKNDKNEFTQAKNGDSKS